MTNLNWQNPSIDNNASLTLEKLRPYLDKAQQLLEHLNANEGENLPPFTTDMLSGEDATQVSNWAKKLRENNKFLVILGTGGSSRGGQSVCVLKKQTNFDNHSLRPLFFENLGVHSMDKMFRDFDLEKTHFLVISKSGTTSETLAQCIVCMSDYVEKAGKATMKNHFTVITDEVESPLSKLARDNDFKVFTHPKDLGGRYSVLSVVGMAPALAVGIDTKTLLSSAKATFSHLLDPAIDISKKNAAMGAAMQAYLYKHEGISQSVFMPYDTRLVPLSRWFQQLWAESIGKNGIGTTPSSALGPVDQHSQLQLYLQGPRDKYFTIIIENIEGKGQVIDPDLCKTYGINYLANHTIGDLVSAEAKATIKTLEENNRPVRVITCSKIDEGALGQLFANYMMETIIMAHLMGVNPYDQPAVERSKQLTRSTLRG